MRFFRKSSLAIAVSLSLHSESSGSRLLGIRAGGEMTSLSNTSLVNGICAPALTALSDFGEAEGMAEGDRLQDGEDIGALTLDWPTASAGRFAFGAFKL